MRFLNNRVAMRPERMLLADGGGTGAAAPALEQTQPAVDTQTPTGFQYQHEDAYQRLLRQAAGQSAFRYNPNRDPVMQAYTRAYRREGERATANALAQAAAATGGIPSSYAVGAAQQAGAYYASQMADKFPELEQQAYQRYLNERAATLQGLEALSADREDAYSKYLRRVAQEQQAKQDAAAQSLTSGEVDADTVADTLQMYPDGKVTNSHYWESLLRYFTEEALAAKGITYAGG